MVAPPSFHTLAILPANAITDIGVFLGLAILCVGLMHGITRLRAERIVMGIAFIGVVLSVLGVVQHALDVRDPEDKWQLVYGFWKPIHAGNVFGPFINRNHFAGWMVMALSLTLGYAVGVFEATAPPAGHGWRRWTRWTMTPEASRFMTLSVAVVAMGT